MTVLTLKARQDHLQKVASTRDPVKALAEFVWNSVDADATRVDVVLERNVLGGLESILIRDNGEGISPERASHDFENVGDSWKRVTPKTRKHRSIHGKEGQGRLRFFSLANHAQWETCHQGSAGKPKQNNRRILAQQGAFLLFGLPTLLKDENDFSVDVVRTVIPASAKQGILRQLDRVNINESSLFPEIDKAAAYIMEQLTPIVGEERK